MNVSVETWLSTATQRGGRAAHGAHFAVVVGRCDVCECCSFAEIQRPRQITSRIVREHDEADSQQGHPNARTDTIAEVLHFFLASFKLAFCRSTR